MLLPLHDPLVATATEVIRAGDIDALNLLLAEHPHLASARLIDETPGKPRTVRTLLHVATDWPGHFTNGAAAVSALVAAGADVNARFEGPHRETPLHWAASCDDLEVLDTLLDLGADIEADGAVIAGGTPLADAVAFGQWNAAQRLIERGAKTKLWQAAALGLIDRIERQFADGKPPSTDECTQAFWLACHGAQQPAAEILLQRGANINWVGYDDLTPLDAAVRSEATELAQWLTAHGAKSAASLNDSPPE